MHTASGASGKSWIVGTQLSPASVSRLGFTTHICPKNPARRASLMATAASAPPMKAICRGRNSLSKFWRLAGVMRSGAEGPQDRARDDMALDFAGAIPDPLQPAVAPEALQGHVLHQAHAAIDLTGVVRDPIEHLRAVDLDHRGIGILKGAALGPHHGVGDHQIGGTQVHRGIGQPESRGLKPPDGLSELTTSGRPFRRQPQNAFGLAATTRPDPDPAHAKPLTRELQALALFAQNLLRSKAHIVERKLKGLVSPVADALVAFAAVKAGRAHIHQKGSDALACAAG